jgi:hypothetical protein
MGSTAISSKVYWRRRDRFTALIGESEREVVGRLPLACPRMESLDVAKVFRVRGAGQVNYED